MSVSSKKDSVKKLDRLVWLMDRSIPIPGTEVRFGLDGLIGLIPGIGDTAGAIISSYILAEAAKMGASKSVLLKMAFNIGVDALLGIVPILGDFTDFLWKANVRNVKLLNDFLEQPQKTEVQSRLFVGFLVLLVLGSVVFIGMLGFLLVRLLWTSV